jgi:hypothetical protein
VIITSKPRAKKRERLSLVGAFGESRNVFAIIQYQKSRQQQSRMQKSLHFCGSIIRLKRL